MNSKVPLEIHFFLEIIFRYITLNFILQFPETQADWLEQAKLFDERWQFPNCLGAVDGKHVAIIPPPGSGSYYFNYKGFHSMVLMAVANANCEFLYVHFGTNGRVSDGGVLTCTDFFQMLTSDNLNLPKANQSNGLPYVFISDEAFVLRRDFMKPYNIRVLDNYKRIFNYRLSRARRVVENAFGILASRFRVFQKPFNLKPDNIETVVMACCVLHNFLRRRSSAYYSPPESMDSEAPLTHEIRDGYRTEGASMANIANGFNRHAPEDARQVRDSFKDLFNNQYTVPWQEKYALN